MNLEKLKQEYATQDNRCTAFPIYVQVQELVFVGVIADEYSVSSQCGGETKVEYKHEDYDEPFSSEEEAKKQIQEDCDGDTGRILEKIADIEEINCGYMWDPVEFFLTIKGAEEYMRRNKHNHGKLRTYVSHFHRRNFEMREFLDATGFKVKD